MSEKGWHVDFTPPTPIDDAAAERISSKQVQRGQCVGITPPPSTMPPWKESPQNEFKGHSVWISHCPPLTMPLQEEYTPLMRGFNKVEGSACRLSHCPVVDMSLLRIFGRDRCNRGSGRNHAALHWGATFANGLAVRCGQWA